MLLQERITSDTMYPVVETVVHHRLTDRTYLLLSGCFHDLGSATDQELAGMGLAIIGNLCKLMHEAETQALYFEPSLQLSCSPDAEGIRLPWPGMPDDNPALPLMPERLPFDAAMFFTGDGHGQRRVDRIALMRRIEGVWVPHLKRMLWRSS